MKMKKLNQKDRQIIAHLRTNARNTLTNISENTNIPITTIFDKIRSYEKELIKRYTCLMDFSKLGYNSRVKFAIKANGAGRRELQDFLLSHKNINSVFRVDPKYDFLVEAYFKTPIEAYDFSDTLQSRFSIEECMMINVIDELQSEEMMAKHNEEDDTINVDYH